VKNKNNSNSAGTVILQEKKMRTEISQKEAKIKINA
jgi:hypothetical protein